MNATHKTDRFDVTRNAPVLGLLLTKLKFSTQQEDIKFTKYEETYAVKVKRFAQYDTEVDIRFTQTGDKYQETYAVKVKRFVQYNTEVDIRFT